MKHIHALSGIALTVLMAASSTLALSAPALAEGTIAATASQADPIQKIRVEGNQRVEGRTILSYLNMNERSSFSREEIDAGLKSLYSTGFFADVKLLREGNDLLVKVIENPVVSKVALEGNDRVEEEDLINELELKPRSIYSREKVQKDVRRILDIYRRGGRYNATVTPKVIQRDQNRVDLVYEITEGEIAYVEKISFIGNERFSDGTLQDAIRTEENSWMNFLSDDDKYDPDRLLYDQELLRRFYLGEGYIDFQVKSAHAELSPSKDAFYLTFVVEEGPQYNFGVIKVSSALKTKNPINYHEHVITEAGDIYDAVEVEQSIESLTNELGNRGFAFVDIQPKIDRHPDKKLADLTYVIKPGPRVYVERINVTGNVRTLDKVVRREFRLNEGDPYNASKMKRSEQRINNLGYFEKVDVTTEQGSAPDKTVVNVDVEEKSTGEVNIGAGYSTANGVIATLGVTENNLMGRGQKLKASFTLGTLVTQGELSFTEPYFLNREIAAGFDLYRIRQDLTDQNTYESDTTGIRLRSTYTLQEKLTHGVNFSLRRNNITDVTANASHFIRRQEGKYTTSSIGQTLLYDDRDNKFTPTSGAFVKFDQEIAGLGGDARFISHELNSSYHQPLYTGWTLAFLASGGYIYGFGGEDIRISDRFFIGGNSMRGFETAGIGPRDTSTDDALGGNAFYVGTVELLFPLGLPEDLGLSGAIFTDIGSVWETDDVGANIFDENTPRVTVGVGALWNSPFGPIRVDFAQAIKKESEDVTENINFSFGARF